VPTYRGAYQNKQTGRWAAIITVNKQRIQLGTFDSQKDASDAYFAAKAIYSDPVHGKALREADSGAKDPIEARKQLKTLLTGTAHRPPTLAAPADPSESPAAAQAPPAGDAAPATAERAQLYQFRGVVKDADSDMWEAVITVNGQEISGGEYDTAEEAAKAYDALARMYLGADAATNFAVDLATSWVPPDEVVHTGQIATKPGEPFTVEEVESALKQERGIDVRTIDLAGKSDLAEHMVFVTGRDARHMGRMADMLSRALRKRKLPGIDHTVEARDMDDWMVVDAGNVIVNVMDAEARECFALEDMYENMKLGEEPDAGLTYDEWLEKYPIPEKWLRRLERDEEEIEAAQRMRASGEGGDGKRAGKKRRKSRVQ
jgi:ribosome-associated protein